MMAPALGQGGPFHAGEVAVQQRLGVAERMQEVGARVVRDHMPEQHRLFFEQLPWLLVGSVDAQLRPWASVLSGPPGFIRTPDERQLWLQAQPRGGDPLADALQPGAALGFLGIELHTRRRNRVNGVLGRRDAQGLHVTVTQSVGNCPRYIRSRDWVPGGTAADGLGLQHAMPEPMEGWTAADRRWIAGAETCFVATHAPGVGSDVSHRGGRPGFVQLLDDGSLLMPDFNGNAMFMTWGNLLLHPRAGLLFPDFEHGGLLSLTGRVELLWGPQDWPALAEVAGAERAWRFHPEAGWRWARSELAGQWQGGAASPHALATGVWPAAAGA
ncbi:pyridoxamine 5'-phosphate oxidase family protein [Roseateles sp. BYS87W]|uniref:Pyridoxamine 5'-phosphate oxidase family protein n=1 Tax=Pelomonas baiyunensis TaxID=3299026 RepID=A0ABW7GW70_9BURK